MFMCQVDRRFGVLVRVFLLLSWFSLLNIPSKLVAISDDISKIKISITEALKNKNSNLKNRLSLAMENTYQKRTKKMLMELN